MTHPHTRWALILAFTLLSMGGVACGEDEKDDTSTEADTDTDTDADTDTDVDCTTLDVEACAAESACRVIDGRPLSSDPKSGAPCVDFSVAEEPLGCMDADGGCGDAETLGTAGETCTHWFSDTCLPTGWSVCTTPQWVESCGG